MKSLRVSLVVALLGLTGCRSDDAHEPDFPCNCGTPAAAMETCLHPLCADGKSNPDNPDCACGTLSFKEEN